MASQIQLQIVLFLKNDTTVSIRKGEKWVMCIQQIWKCVSPSPVVCRSILQNTALETKLDGKFKKGFKNYIAQRGKFS